MKIFFYLWTLKTNKKLIMNRYRIINTNNKESTGLLIDFVAC